MTQDRTKRLEERARQRGYPAERIPNEWIGLNVAMNILTGQGPNSLLGVIPASGLLEAVREDGYVISVGDRTVFFPLHSVLQIELYDAEL